MKERLTSKLTLTNTAQAAELYRPAKEGGRNMQTIASGTVSFVLSTIRSRLVRKRMLGEEYFRWTKVFFLYISNKTPAWWRETGWRTN